MLRKKFICFDNNCSSQPYLEVYCNLYYLLAQSEEMSATDKWPGFVLTKEGEEFVQQNAHLFKYDLMYNPLRFESWQRLANIYDEVKFPFSSSSLTGLLLILVGILWLH